MAPQSLSNRPIRDLFASDITRDIPPVVYLHEQSPDRLRDEVSEYIITGGWPEGHPNLRRVPRGIHEEYVSLLRNLTAELEKPGGTDLPNVWISGFFGSGKSSFAKLLGLSLDGVALPDGRSLAEAWLARDTSPRAHELREAWTALRAKVDPVGVVFDAGGAARDTEHIHSVALRQLQIRLGYSTDSMHVAAAELMIERDGRFADLEKASVELFGQPWSAINLDRKAQSRFSNLMARVYPEIFTSDFDWHARHAGVGVNLLSPEETVEAMADMLRFRRPNASVFFVIDEVSQYVLANTDRIERLRAFASALGAKLRGKVWLIALGQQKLEENADDAFLVKMKDRFPPHLRVHLAPTNIRDVVHRRLLRKRPEVEAELRALFQTHRASLQLYAYGCDHVTPDDFVDVYPMLPGHIDLLLQITTALRVRSTRAQGDDQAIRGLLQLLGELFRNLKLADRPVGALVTLDQIYEVQQTALDSDVQRSMARVLDQCADDSSGLLARVAKVVALLELIQETLPTDAQLVARCLYDQLDRGNQVAAVTDALETLRRRNLLGFSEKHGYKLQSSAGEEWERDRRDIGVTRERQSESVEAALKYLLASPERPKLQGRPFPWAGRFSDGRRALDVILADPRDDAAVVVDLRWFGGDERDDAAWVKRSDETALRDRLVWVSGEVADAESTAVELHRSMQMVAKYKPRRESLIPAKRMLLQQEENRAEELERDLQKAVAAAFMTGRFYFRGRGTPATDHGASFATALAAAGTRALPELFTHYVPFTVQPAELLQLVATDLSGPSPRFLPEELGILELDSGRYTPSCAGVVPRRIHEHLERESGVSGTLLLAHFGGPPFGYTANVVKACVAGLLRAGKLRIQPEAGAEITAYRDGGVREIFEKDRSFRRASFFVAGEDDIGYPARARICAFFDKELGTKLDREDHAIADAVSSHFPAEARRLRAVLQRLDQLPGRPAPPTAFTQLQDALEACVAHSRQTRPTVQLVKQKLDILRDGVQLLRAFEAELTPQALQSVRAAADVRDHQLAQLAQGEDAALLQGELLAAADRLRAQLASERPWRDISAIDPDLVAIRAAYVHARAALIAWRGEQVEAARALLRAREGFALLTADQAHQVMRPLTRVDAVIAPEAVAPALDALRAPFLVALQAAVREAHAVMDSFASAREPIIAVDLHLQNRELRTEADVDALLAELRERLLAQVRGGSRVRLV